MLNGFLKKSKMKENAVKRKKFLKKIFSIKLVQYLILMFMMSMM